MKTTKHGAYLYKLTKYGLINCYLVDEGDGLTLIDANISGQGAAILKAVADIGKPIHRILITHGHVDHVGSIDEILESEPGIEFLPPKRSAPLMKGDFSLEPSELEHPIKGSNFPLLKSEPMGLISDGDQVGSLLAYASPGHSVDHISWLDQRDGTLIAGDSWQTAGGLAAMGDTRWLFPFPSLATHHKLTALQSAKLLLDLKPKRLAPGHGRVIEDAYPAMQKAYARAERKITK